MPSFHDQLIAKMRARAHRAPGPGVEFSSNELIERAKPTHDGIGSLAVDVRYTLLEDTAPAGSEELATDFFAFASEWVKFHKRITAAEDVPKAAEAIDEFDRRYRFALLAYQQLGFRPSRQPSPCYRTELESVARQTVMKPLPIGRLLAVGGGALAVFFYFQKKRRDLLEPDQKPPIRVGPPVPEAPLLPEAPTSP